MKIYQTNLKDAYILEPNLYGNSGGWTCESFSDADLKEHGIDYTFVCDNHSFFSIQGTLSGLHVQTGNDAQAIIVRCIKGEVLFVAVDLREGSPTYLKCIGELLTQDNFKQLLLPPGFARGFLTLTPKSEIILKANRKFCPELQACIAWNDPELNIDWKNANPVLCDIDKNAPLLKDSGVHFSF